MAIDPHNKDVVVIDAERKIKRWKWDGVNMSYKGEWGQGQGTCDECFYPG